LVKIPQFIIVFVEIYQSDNYQSQGTTNVAAYYCKIALTGLYVFALVISLVCYPCLRNMLANKFGSKEFDLQLYVVFQIDKRINQLLGVVYDPKNPNLKPVYVEAGGAGAASDAKMENPRADSVQGQKHEDVGLDSALSAVPDAAFVPSELSAPIGGIGFHAPHTPAAAAAAAAAGFGGPVSPPVIATGAGAGYYQPTQTPTQQPTQAQHPMQQQYTQQPEVVAPGMHMQPSAAGQMGYAAPGMHVGGPGGPSHNPYAPMGAAQGEMTVACSRCGQPMRVPVSAPVGQAYQCPKCGNLVVRQS